MARKISDLSSADAAAVSADDLLHLVDVDDTTMSATGTNKKVTAQLLANELAGLATSVPTVVQDALNLKQDAATAVTGVDATADDVLSVSGNGIAADDPGADRIIFWDDSEGKLRHLEAGSGLTITDTTITASGGVSGVGTTTADVFSVSGSDLVADDPNEDRLVFWDDSAGKLIYASLGPGISPSAAGTTLFNSSNTFFIPTDQWYPRTTNGAGTTTEEFVTNKTNWKELLFDDSTAEYAQVLTQLPSHNAQSLIGATIYWATTATSGNVVWGIRGRYFTANDNVSLDSGFGTAGTTTDTANGSADTVYAATRIDFTPTGTGSSSPLLLEIYRDAADVADTLTGDVKLLGVTIHFNLSY